MDEYLLRNRLRFAGTGADLFGIYIVNLLLSIVTLGLYYPWARVAVLRYTYANTYLDDTSFQFHGTGRELFKGFIRAVGVLLLIYGAFFGIPYLPVLEGKSVAFMMGVKVVLYLTLYLVLLALVPVVIHGALRYRLSRTSWQGIHFGYRGDRAKFVKLYLVQVFLTIITLGLYGFVMQQNVLRYTINRMRFGSARMRYEGDGGDYLALNIKGYFLSFITLGIYSFWWMRDRFDFFVDHLAVEHEGKTYRFQSDMSVSTYAWLLIGNVLLVIFTLGLGAAWAQARLLRTALDHVLLDERFNAETLMQTELDYRDATGEDLADMMDIGLV